MSDDSYVIVALPQITTNLPNTSDDPLHVTLAYFEGPDETGVVEDMLVQIATELAMSTGSFSSSISGRGRLGEQDAAVLFMESDELAEVHDRILDNPYLDVTESFPTWIPHLTLGFGEECDIERMEVQSFPREIVFDRLGVWGPTGKAEFQLSGLVDTNWSYLDNSANMLSMDVVTAALNHFDETLHPRGGDGKFIQKFGVIKWIHDGKWQYGKVVGIESDPASKGDALITVLPSDLSGVYITGGKQVTLKPKKVFAAPKPKAVLPISHADAKKIGNQAGSNPGGLYSIQDPGAQTESKWYVKKAKSADHGRNEWLANLLYGDAGVAAPDVIFKETDGNIYSPITAGKHDMDDQIASGNKEWLDAVRRNFAVDAWLANHDVFGLTNDNILTDEHGTPWRIDNGGALLFRAQGAAKADFGDKVPELETFPKFQKKMYGADLTLEQQLDGANRILAITPDHIQDRVAQVGLPKSLADTLIARRAYIANFYGLPLPESIVHPDANPDAPTSAPIFDAADVLQGHGKSRDWFPVPMSIGMLVLKPGDRVQFADGSQATFGFENGEPLGGIARANQLLGWQTEHGPGSEILVKDTATAVSGRPEHGGVYAAAELSGIDWQRGDRVTRGGTTYDVLWMNRKNGGMLVSPVTAEGTDPGLPFIIDTHSSSTKGTFTVTRWDPPAAKVETKAEPAPVDIPAPAPAPEPIATLPDLVPVPVDIPEPVTVVEAPAPVKEPSLTTTIETMTEALKPVKESLGQAGAAMSSLKEALDQLPPENKHAGESKTTAKPGAKSMVLGDGTEATPGDKVYSKLGGGEFIYVKAKGPYAVVTDPNSAEPDKLLQKKANTLLQPGKSPAVVPGADTEAPKSANGKIPQIGQLAEAKDGHKGKITMISPDGNFVFITDDSGVKKRKSIGTVTLIGDSSLPEPVAEEINNDKVVPAPGKIAPKDFQVGQKVSATADTWYEVTAIEGNTAKLHLAKYNTTIDFPLDGPSADMASWDVVEAEVVPVPEPDNGTNGEFKALNTLLPSLKPGDKISHDGKEWFTVTKKLEDGSIEVNGEGDPWPIIFGPETTSSFTVDPAPVAVDIPGADNTVATTGMPIMGFQTLSNGDTIVLPSGKTVTVLSIPVTPHEVVVPVKDEEGKIWPLHYSSIKQSESYTVNYSPDNVSVGTTDAETAEINKIWDSEWHTGVPYGLQSVYAHDDNDLSLEALGAGIDTDLHPWLHAKEIEGGNGGPYSHEFWDLTGLEAKKWDPESQVWIAAPDVEPESMPVDTTNLPVGAELTGKQYTYTNAGGFSVLFHQLTNGDWLQDGSSGTITISPVSMQAGWALPDDMLPVEVSEPSSSTFSGYTPEPGDVISKLSNPDLPESEKLLVKKFGHSTWEMISPNGLTWQSSGVHTDEQLEGFPNKFDGWTLSQVYPEVGDFPAPAPDTFPDATQLPPVPAELGDIGYELAPGQKIKIFGNYKHGIIAMYADVDGEWHEVTGKNILATTPTPAEDLLPGASYGVAWGPNDYQQPGDVPSTPSVSDVSYSGGFHPAPTDVIVKIDPVGGGTPVYWVKMQDADNWHKLNDKGQFDQSGTDPGVTSATIEWSLQEDNDIAAQVVFGSLADVKPDPVEPAVTLPGAIAPIDLGTVSFSTDDATIGDLGTKTIKALGILPEGHTLWVGSNGTGPANTVYAKSNTGQWYYVPSSEPSNLIASEPLASFEMHQVHFGAPAAPAPAPAVDIPAAPKTLSLANMEMLDGSPLPSTDPTLEANLQAALVDGKLPEGADHIAVNQPSASGKANVYLFNSTSGQVWNVGDSGHLTLSPKSGLTADVLESQYGLYLLKDKAAPTKAQLLAQKADELGAPKPDQLKKVQSDKVIKIPEGGTWALYDGQYIALDAGEYKSASTIATSMGPVSATSLYLLPGLVKPDITSDWLGKNKPSQEDVLAWGGPLTKDGFIPSVGLYVKRASMTGGKIIGINKDKTKVTVLLPDGTKSLRQIDLLTIDYQANFLAYAAKKPTKPIPAGMPLAVDTMEDALKKTAQDGKWRALLPGQEGIRNGEMFVYGAKTPSGKTVNRVFFTFTKEQRLKFRQMLESGPVAAPEKGDWINSIKKSQNVAVGDQIGMRYSTYSNAWKVDAAIKPPTHTIKSIDNNSDGTFTVTMSTNGGGEDIVSIFQPDRDVPVYNWDPNKIKPVVSSSGNSSPLKLSAASKAEGWSITDGSTDTIISAVKDGHFGHGVLDVEPGLPVPDGKAAFNTDMNYSKSGISAWKPGGLRLVSPDGVVIEVTSLTEDDHSYKGNVVVTLPEGAGPEVLNSALDRMGVAHIPLTQAQAKANVLPLLRSLVSNDTSDIDTAKSYSAETLFSKAGLSFGIDDIGWDDVLIGVDESNGKTSYFWSDRVIEAIQKKSKIKVVYRGSNLPTGGSAAADLIVSTALHGTANAVTKRVGGLIHTPTAKAALGASPASDAGNNAGHGGFLSATPNNVLYGHNSEASYVGSDLMVYHRAEGLFGRIMDYRMSVSGDAFGAGSGGGTSNLQTAMTAGKVKDIIANGGLPAESLGLIAVDSPKHRDEALKKLHDMGIDTINALKIEDLIVLKSDLNGKKADETMAQVFRPPNMRPITELPESYDAAAAPVVAAVAA